MGLSTSAGIGIISTTLGVSFAAAVLAVGSAPAGSADESAADDSFTGVSYPDVGSCESLLDRYVERGVRQVTAWGWTSPILYFDSAMRDAVPMAKSPSASLETGVSGQLHAAAAQRATSSGTGTNVQEAGVDEPDSVKTDGRVLVRVRGGDLLTYDVTGADPELVSTIDLPASGERELLLVGDRVVVTGHGQRSDDLTTSTRVVVVDLADPEAPQVVDDATYDADLVAARLNGDTVRLVLSSGLPDLHFVQPHRWWRGEESALQRNRDIVRESTIADWLPMVTRDGDSSALLDCADVEATEDAGLGTLSVVGFDPADPDTTSGTGLITTSTLVYFSTDRMYVATSPYDTIVPGPSCCIDFVRPSGGGNSRLFAFGLDGSDTTYLASGEVAGQIADRWSMDEYAGVLRVAVGPTWSGGNANSIVLLREDGDRLVETGRVGGLGVGETIESMRWFDGLAIMVTYRQVDPLYAVDLTDPDAPRLLGHLKIPGFSEYLHPLGSQRLVGMGQTGTGLDSGARAALFNVADLTDPRQLDVVEYGPGSTADAAADPRQFTWLPEERTVLTVVSTGHAGWVSVLHVDDGRMHNRMVEVAHGEGFREVRLVPLPDGRVVLVTANAVTSFAV